MEFKQKYEYIDFLFFLSMLFIGSDIFSISISGSTVRIIQFLLLIITFIYLLNKKYRLSNIFTLILFLISNILSTFVSVNQKASILYILWTIFNYMFIFCLFYSWTIRKSNTFIYNIWRRTFIIQGWLIIIQFLFGVFGVNLLSSQNYLGIPRPALWFYEPSYLATYFIIFFTISMFMYMSTQEKKYRNDTILSIIFIGFITSSSGFIGVGIGFILCIIFVKIPILNKMKGVMKAICIFLMCSISVYFIYPRIFDIFLGRLFREGLVVSSGDRMYGWDIAFNIFKNHEIFGIGPNAYQTYTGLSTPPTNVTLEILCYLGVLGIITFSIFIISIIIKGRKNIEKFGCENKLLGKAIILSFIVFVIVLQFNQNYLRLYMWMHMGIIAGLSNKKIN